MAPRVVLVGPPGSGKSTVGQLLAERIPGGFRDTDADVEATAGKPISDIFLAEGEEAFRKLETEALRVALAEHPGVLALGGGIVLAPENRAALAGHRVAYLSVRASEAASRVGFDTARPLLLGNPRARLRQLLAEREPWYVEVATTTYPTDGKTPAEVAIEIEASL